MIAILSLEEQGDSLPGSPQHHPTQHWHAPEHSTSTLLPHHAASSQHAHHQMQSATPANGKPTRPKQKRIRKGAACNGCRVRRCRCDGERPMCGTCLHNNEPECTYNAMELRPRTAILQQRVDDLEAQLRLANEISNKIEIIRTRLPSASDLPMRVHSSGTSISPLAPERYLDAAQHLQMQLISVVDPMFGSWWETEEQPPSGLITVLINQFAMQEHRHSHDPLTPAFYASLHNPDSDTGPHLALQNTIFLLGSAYGGGVLSVLEPVFLRRAIFYLGQSLAKVDRLLDCIEAHTLLGNYYCCRGRQLQGVRNASTNILLAAACGLHVLSPPHWTTNGTPSLLAPPASWDEVRRRIRVWWMVFVANRLGSAAVMTTNDLPDENITTIWELPPAPVNSEMLQLSTIKSLYTREGPESYVYNDTANVLFCKTVALIERAGQVGVLAAITPKEDVAYWEKFELTEHILDRVTRSLPSIYEEARFTPNAPRVVLRAVGKTNPYIICPHLFVCDAMILLHKGLARAGNAASRDICLTAVWRAMQVVRKVQEQNMGGWVIPTMVTARIFQVFAEEYERLYALGDIEGARVLLPELKILAQTIKEQITHYPLAKVPFGRLKKHFPSLFTQPGFLSQ
ncbi:hypothetical protein BOTBODRAFT_39917 [Botryobasidium botryosum FD-172 SS1]|uniref:Zn(2)-C6 fungal-type domain-containing protein n=1 Tax=Botryobasidium botryosum (strain FD-172 SS1) TaxID=930990 RepID=A0A067LRN8_BOTB1|nr:hypothetical protein BOTBODRAFT_39917 [Botryobasidium botryosum FD-172 SS1]